MWDKIKTSQVQQQAKKAPDVLGQHKTTPKKQTRKNNKFVLLFFYSCYDDWFFDSCPVEVIR